MNTLKRILSNRAVLFTGLLAAASVTQAQLFEAENYSNYYDTTSGNSGGEYRSDDVDIQITSDSSGGYNVGWINATEWLVYENLQIAEAGQYVIKMRVSSTAGAQTSIDLNGGSIVLAQVDIPNTGSWQNWVTVETTVDLNTGVFDLGVYAQTGNWNFNWISVEKVTVAQPDPERIEAENYASFHDTTAGNQGGAYRSDNVDIETTTDQDGGYNVGWFDTGEWLSYNDLTIPSDGTYEIKLRVASVSGASANLDLNGGSILLGQIDIPATGGWQNWETVSITQTLTAGMYSFGVYSLTSGWNLNWIEIVKVDNNGGVDPSLVWGDEFDSIDYSVWNVEVAGHGFGNNELQWYSNGDNIYVSYDNQAQSNVLVIEARQEQGGQCWWGGSCGYTSGRLNTNGTKSFKYGRLEARMKLPKTQGIWPAFWMLGDNFNSQGWPQGGEIDIMEHVGTNNITSGALHGPGYSGNTPITGHLDHATSIDQGYHVYAIEWDETGIRWFVDNINFYSVTKAEVQRYGEYVYDQPFWFLLNLAVGGNWPGDPDHANFTTQRMYVDYIRVYQE